MSEIRIVEIIYGVTYVLPVAMMIWKMSGLYSQVERNKKDIDGLGVRIGRTFREDKKLMREISDKIDKMQGALIKIDTLVNVLRDKEQI